MTSTGRAPVCSCPRAAPSFHASDIYGSCADYVREVDQIIVQKDPKRALQSLVRLEIEVKHISSHAVRLRRLLRGVVDRFSQRFGAAHSAKDRKADVDRVKGLVKYLDERLVPQVIADMRRFEGGKVRKRDTRG